VDESAAVLMAKPPKNDLNPTIVKIPGNASHANSVDVRKKL